MDYIKKIRKYTSVFMAAVIAAAAVAGCAGQNSGKTSESNIIENSYEDEIRFTDAAGREITLDKPAERIVSGYYITSSMLIALGVKDQTVGIEAKADKRPIYKMAAPEFLQLPNVGTSKEFDLEGCISLEPDLVILPIKLTEQAEILSDMGIPAIVVNPESMEALKETIVMLGKASGQEERAASLISYYDERTELLKNLVENRKASDEKTPKIYIAGTSDILRAAAPAMYQNSLIELSGGKNAAFDLTDKSWTNISYEKLLSYDPDMIIVIPEADYTKEDVLEDEQLQGVRAVASGAVYEMPSAFEAWDSPVPSGILGGMWLSSIVNEEQYPFEAFRKDAVEFYKRFYGVDIEPSLIIR